MPLTCSNQRSCAIIYGQLPASPEKDLASQQTPFFSLPWAIFLRFPGASPGRYVHNSGMGFTSGQTPHLFVRTILRRKRHLATENGWTPCYYSGIRRVMRIAFQDLILHSYCFFPRFPHLLSRTQVLDWRSRRQTEWHEVELNFGE